MLQIPVSDSRGEAGVNGVTFSVVPRARSGTLLLAARAIHRGPILDRQITRRGTTLHLNNSKHIFETLCPLCWLSLVSLARASLVPVSFGTFRVPGSESRDPNGGSFDNSDRPRSIDFRRTRIYRIHRIHRIHRNSLIIRFSMDGSVVQVCFVTCLVSP